jgi:hypothetical protein
VAAVFGKIISEAYRAGAWRSRASHGTRWPCDPGLPVPESFVPDAARLRDAIIAGVPDEVAAGHSSPGQGCLAWSLRVVRAVRERGHRPGAFFDHAAARLGLLTGLPA